MEISACGGVYRVIKHLFKDYGKGNGELIKVLIMKVFYAVLMNLEFIPRQ